MPVDVTVNPVDIANVQRILNGAIPNWDVVMRQVGVATVGWIDQNFRSQGRLAIPGRGWAPLKPITVQMRRADPHKAQAHFLSTGRGMGYRQNLGPTNYKILEDSGELRGSWSYDVQAYGIAAECRIGSNSIKSGTHQYGRRMFWPLIRRMVTIPARPMVPPARIATRMLSMVVTAHVNAGLASKKVGGPTMVGKLSKGVKA